MATLRWEMIGNKITYYLPDATECAAFQKRVQAMEDPPAPTGPVDHLALARQLLDSNNFDGYPEQDQLLHIYRALRRILAHLQERG